MTKDLNKHKHLITKMIEREKPETAKQILTFMQKHHNLTEEQTTKLLFELEKENKLQFTKQSPLPATPIDYILSAKAIWYWIIITLVSATTVVVFTIPENSYPLMYLRFALGLVFLFFLPGYALIKMLFPLKVPIQRSTENKDTIERVALSFGMSLVISPIVGLILNYSPWGVRIISITLSLLLLTITFATIAILREFQIEINLLPQKNTKKSSEKKTKKTKI